MATVRVNIHNREYHLACDDGQEEQLIGLSQEVDDRVRALGRAMPQAGEAMLLLLSAITLADELSDTKRNVRQLQSQLKKMQEMVNEEEHLHDQARLVEMEAAMAATLQEVAARIEKIAEQLEG